jgi:hypothetical protein
MMNILIEKNLQVPMRDGLSLATDVYRPSEEGRFPTLLARLPYNKELLTEILPSLDVFRAVQAGYAIVVQDARGCFASDGEFDPFFQEADDGADAIAWAADQPWSDGNVGGFGRSYLGVTQLAAATRSPQALRAIAPARAPATYYGDLAYQGGTFQLGADLLWALVMALGEQQRRLMREQAAMDDMGATLMALGDVEALYRKLPLVDVPPLEGVASYYFDWVRHRNYDDYWRAISTVEVHDQITVPALHIGGWYDFFLGGTLANYRGIKEHGGGEIARDNQRLIIGPWSHQDSTGSYPGRYYGVMAHAEVADLTGEHLRWFDRWLKGDHSGVEDDKAVKIFVMGVDQWREEDDWPLPDTRYRNYYLHSGGRANSSSGDGSLLTEEPLDEPEDVFRYDPHNPVPTVGGATLLGDATNVGPRDQREVEAREDVLCYTTPPQESAIEVTGPVELVLYISSSARDTDFTGKLVDVYPDGRAENLTDGILRTRYRESFTKPEHMQPGKVYELHVDLWATSNVFLPGHRIRFEVSSSNFPRFDRNTNTGGNIFDESEADFVTATNRVHHSSPYPSRLLLPIIERG